jgi:predicted RNA-binding Zn-ribbon protein involved in translation (DUF1610 family)
MTQSSTIYSIVIIMIWLIWKNGPINVPLFTTAEREWETCRHYIDQEVLKRDKTHCPSCGKEHLVRSSDAIVKLRRLSSAGKVHNPENERT